MAHDAPSNAKEEVLTCQFCDSLSYSFLILSLSIFLLSSILILILSLPFEQSAVAQTQSSLPNTSAMLYDLQHGMNNSKSVQQTIKQNLTYENPTLAIAIAYPTQWTKSESGRGVTFSAPPVNASDTFQETLDIHVHPSQNQTLDSFVNNDTNDYRQNYKAFQLLNKSASNMGDIPASKLEYTYNDGHEEVKIMEEYVIEGDNLYDFIYTAEPDRYVYYLPIIQQMINSFQRGFITYENPTLAIAIEYPTEWTKSESGRGVTFSAPPVNASDTFKETLDIRVHPSQNQTLDSFVNNDTNTNQESLKNYELLNNSTIATHPIVKTNLGKTINQTREIDYKYTDKKEGNITREHIVNRIFAINNDNIYTITYTAGTTEYANHRLSVAKLIDSFKVIEFFPVHQRDFLRYQNNTNGISLKYPHDWSAKTAGDQVKFQSPSNENNSTMSVSVKSLSPATDFSDTIVRDIDYEKQNLNGFRIIESNSTIVANNPAHKLVYTYVVPQTGRLYQGVAIYIDTLKTNQKYQISYLEEPGSYSSSYLPIIQTMIKSLEIHVGYNTQLFKPAIGVGISPYGIALDSTTNRIYVANSESNTVSVIDGTRNKVVKNITLSSSPYGLAVDSVSHRIYVTVGQDKVAVIDGTTNSIMQEISVKGDEKGDFNPVDIAVDSSPNNNYAFIANKNNESVTVIDASSNSKLEDIPLESTPYSATPQALALNPITHRLYVADANLPGTVSVIDYYTDTSGGFNYLINDIQVGNDPNSVAVNPRTNTVYVANSNSSSISVIDGTTNRVATNIHMDTSPSGVGVNPSTNKVVVTNFDGTVYVIDGMTNKIANRMITGGSPQFAAVDSNTNMTYVSNSYLNTVSAINDSTNNLVVTLDYKVNDPRAGHLNCNGKDISTNQSVVYNIGEHVRCNAIVNQDRGFSFVSWGGTTASAGDKTNPLEFDATQNGVLTANFDPPSATQWPAYVSESIIALSVALVAHTIIPYIIDMRHKKKQTQYLRSYIPSIDKIYGSCSGDREECLKLLDNVRRDITMRLEQGALAISSFQILDDRVSEYINKINRKDISIR